MDNIELRRATQLAKECPELNQLERELAWEPIAPPPVVHTFTPGLYARTIFLKAGTLCTSKIHKTEHQYIVSRGSCRVWIPGIGWEMIKAPYHGITKVGTRRALHILEDTIWTTFHPTMSTDLDEIENEIIEPHSIPIKPEELT